MGVDPTKLTPVMSLCCKIASTVSFPPFTKFKTPGGIPASNTILDNNLVVVEVASVHR